MTFEITRYSTLMMGKHYRGRNTTHIGISSLTTSIALEPFSRKSTRSEECRLSLLGGGRGRNLVSGGCARKLLLDETLGDEVGNLDCEPRR